MRSVGKSFSKIDAFPIATGKPVYTDDLAPANALIVKLKRSPHPFAKIVSIDTTRAEALQGVACVFTYKNVPQVPFTRAGQSYPEVSPYDKLILDQIVRYVGDEVAIVAAIDEKTANKAIKLIKVKYQVFEPVLDFEKASTHPFPIHPQDVFCHFDVGMDKAKNIASSQKIEIGDLEVEIAQCDFVVEDIYYSQAQAHAMMETFRSYSYLDHMNRLVVVSSTQIPFHVKRMLARALELPSSKIRVIKPRIGGGFGAKQTAQSEFYPALVTLRTGKPAKIVYTRKESFSCSTSRHGMRLKVRLGADKEGYIKVIDIQGLSDTGAYGEHSATVFGVVGAKTLPLYNKTSALRFMGDVVYTNKMPGGALRGYGATQGTYALECTINKLAHKIGMAPDEIRLLNLTKEGEKSFFSGKLLKSSALHRCIEKGKELIGWNDKYPRYEVSKTKVGGIGMAVTMQGSGIANVDTASAEVRLNDDGNYTLLIGSTDMGTGSDTILAQMVCEVLQTSMDKIIVNAADTDVSPYDPGSYASSTTYVTGMAVVMACQDLNKKIIEQGAKHLNTEADNIEFDGEIITNAISNETLSLSKLAQILVLGKGRMQLSGFATYGQDVSPPPFGAGFAQVEVDLETGKIDVVHYVSVLDCGTVINPILATMQAEGGVVMGIGMSLFEDVKYSSTGHLMSNSFMQYKIPSRADIGDITVAFESSYEPTGPFGAKSIGEIVVNTPPPAITHAIYNAVGVWINSLPITPEKLFMEINKK